MLSERRELKVGDTIKCNDANDMIAVMQELEHLDIHTDFMYEKNGKEGFWLKIVK